MTIIWIIWGFVSAALNGLAAWRLYGRINEPDAKFIDKVFFVMTFGLAMILFSILGVIIF